MMDVEKLRRRVRNTKHYRNDAYIDIARHAKVHPSTVGHFLRGETSCPMFLTRWGLEKYLEIYGWRAEQ